MSSGGAGCTFTSTVNEMHGKHVNKFNFCIFLITWTALLYFFTLTLEPFSGVPRHPIQSSRYGNFADFLGLLSYLSNDSTFIEKLA